MKKLTCMECGGEILVSANGLYGKCSYCGSEYQLKEPLNSQQFVSFEMATEYLLTFRFADAKRLFVKLAEDTNFTSAYWGAFLAEYGIEFVIDKFKNKTPTCHRANVVSVYENQYYIKAIEYANSIQLENYKELAEKIERVRLEILNQVEDGTNYQVFICFKATEIEDENKKTADFYFANELYNFLEEKGFKVFNSAKTLLEVKEQNFEPYIYRALSTAKVMLLLCSSVETIESAWVKNEWARFLDLNNGQGLVPICGNLETNFSPLALPHELQKLNAIVYDENVKENILKKVSAFFTNAPKQEEKQEQNEESSVRVEEESVYVYDIIIDEILNYNKAVEIISDVAQVSIEDAKTLIAEKGVILSGVNKIVLNHVINALTSYATIITEQRRIFSILTGNIKTAKEDCENNSSKEWDKNSIIVNENITKIK